MQYWYIFISQCSRIHASVPAFLFLFFSFSDAYSKCISPLYSVNDLGVSDTVELLKLSRQTETAMRMESAWESGIQVQNNKFV